MVNHLWEIQSTGLRNMTLHLKATTLFHHKVITPVNCHIKYAETKINLKWFRKTE